MLNITKFMELIEYKVNFGSRFLWECFGPDAFCIERWDGEQTSPSVTAVFDTKTLVVYRATAAVVAADLGGRAYEWIHPDYIRAYESDLEERGIDGRIAWDDVLYTRLETETDYIDKADKISKGEPYDERIEVELKLTDEELLELFKLAHSKDLTLNALVESILEDTINQYNDA